MGRPLTLGSLFSGIGGFESGFEDAGMECVWQVEKDKDCLRVLEHHWPSVLRIDDVCKAGKKNLPRVDVITFGSPCQDMSVAGKRKGLHGERSGLFFEAIRIVRELRPALAVWENVPGAFSSHAGRDFLAAVRAFHELGARDICWRVLDAQYFGLAQRRERVFLVADFGGERAAEILLESPCRCGHPPKGKEKGKGVAAATDGGIDGTGVTCFQDDSKVTTSAESAYVGLGGSGHPYIAATLNSGGNDGGFRTEPGEHLVAHALCGMAAKGGDPTTDNYVTHALSSVGADASEDGTGRGTPLVAQPLRGNVHNNSDPGMEARMHVQQGMTVRRLAPVECCRLQGFPDDWLDLELPSRHIREGWRFNQSHMDERQIQAKLSDSAKYRMLGNAVAKPVAEWIGKRIKKALKGKVD